MSKLTRLLRYIIDSQPRADGPYKSESTVPRAERPIPDDPRGLYLWLMEEILINTIYEDIPSDPNSPKRFDPERRHWGAEWPSSAHSMIGIERMHSIRKRCEHAIRDDVPGDFIETGVWRGGATIMMRAVLKAYGIGDRRVWVADSFEGLPRPDSVRYPADKGLHLYKYEELAVSLDDVKANFSKYGLLDEQVVFLKGLFSETLPTAPIEKIAVLRLDGDLYESTMDALTNLYEKVSPGGSITIDDYGIIPACRKAVSDFRTSNDIEEPIQWIDHTGVFWIKH